MEGGREHFVALFPAQHVPQTLFQLSRRLIGKGDRHHVPAADGILAKHPIQPSGGVGPGHDGHAQGLDVLFLHLAGGP